MEAYLAKLGQLIVILSICHGVSIRIYDNTRPLFNSLVWAEMSSMYEGKMHCAAFGHAKIRLPQWGRGKSPARKFT